MKLSYMVFLSLSTISTVYATSNNFGQNPALNLVAAQPNVFYGIVNGNGMNISGEGGIYTWNDASNTYAGFADNIPDPICAPLVAKDGSIYQLSYQGGVNNQGALYHIVNGVATIVYAFTSASDGTHPNTIVMVPDGRIFGTTYDGGTFNYGAIFAYNPATSQMIFEQGFDGQDGGYPQGLVYANGYLYGVTQWGGANGVGTIFQYDYNNNYIPTILHSFSKNNDLNGPQTGLSLSNDGNTLMGTTFYNGNDWGGGTYAYSIPDNSYTIVWYGNYYQATPPVQANDGTWYQSAVSTDNHWDILASSYSICPGGFTWEGGYCGSNIKFNGVYPNGDTAYWDEGSLKIIGPDYYQKPSNCPAGTPGYDGVDCLVLTASDKQKYNINGWSTDKNNNLYLTKNSNFAPTVVYSGSNSSPDSGKYFKTDGINGLAYNPADNSLIATQQWGGANGLGFISKFTANGLNAITGTDVYDFAAMDKSNIINISIVNDKINAGVEVFCLPSMLYFLIPSAGTGGSAGPTNLTCASFDNTVILGSNVSGFPNIPPPSGAHDIYNVLNTNQLEYDYLDIDYTYYYINFEYQNGTMHVLYNHDNGNYDMASIIIN